jgi:hypothetical protein
MSFKKSPGDTLKRTWVQYILSLHDRAAVAFHQHMRTKKLKKLVKKRKEKSTEGSRLKKLPVTHPLVPCSVLCSFRPKL